MLARNAEGTRISRPRMALNTLKGIHKEMSRVYRQSLAGNLPSGEMTRLIFGLREIRQTVEAQAQAAVLNLEAVHTTANWTILSVPPGTQVGPNNEFVWPDGTVCPASASEFAPYEPTPDWTALPPPAPEPSIMNAADVTAIEVELPDDPKITRLNPFRSRAGDDSPGVA